MICYEKKESNGKKKNESIEVFAPFNISSQSNSNKIFHQGLPKPNPTWLDKKRGIDYIA